tara:strand:- start:141 stop:413 length:273 start_codon:yes stop_codon:yes gene_type:complete
MNTDKRDWWETDEDDEWEWFSDQEDDADNPRCLVKLRTYAVQFRTDKMHSVEIDGISERDAIQQLTEEFRTEMEKESFKIISVIEVDYDE